MKDVQSGEFGERDVRPREPAYVFGPFRLLPGERKLLLESEPLQLGSRAFALLVALVERAGTVVSGDELMRLAWPNMTVDEANLRVQLGSLRKALARCEAGRRAIQTVPLRGYCFVLPVTLEAAASESNSNARNHNFPAPLTPTIGRDDVIALISKSLTEHRLVTILGPGGIGKTTVALEVSRRSLPGFAHGACFVDFSPLADSHLVPSALASALGISVLSHEPLAGLLACLRGKEKLLLLDTCEHVVDAVASLAEKLLTGLPGLRVLVTSREALRTGGEWVHRLPSLALPAESGALTAAEALAFPSVQLFVQRATATLDQFALGDADAPVVAHICRFLDGIPLAIELAAARVDELGLQEIAARLGDAFSILTHGRRTALPRHQTLAATLSWSYGLLSSDEQVLLRRLAVFRGPFTSEAASIVSESEPGARRHSVATLSSLFMKSLLCAATVADVALYRMLDTTRAFAAGQLAHSGELEMISRRHASYVCDALRDAEGSLESGGRPIGRSDTGT